MSPALIAAALEGVVHVCRAMSGGGLPLRGRVLGSFFCFLASAVASAVLPAYVTATSEVAVGVKRAMSHGLYFRGRDQWLIWPARPPLRTWGGSTPWLSSEWPQRLRLRHDAKRALMMRVIR